ncbi:hypothetical protein [Methylobacterium dankookense]|uniref:hypothetical protein n=1 Tax=Methylobacterium dankookense TaxID=560405 RepID=UPI001643F6AD|nr:hypothetical protein [Methylobacterium dankookense]
MRKPEKPGSDASKSREGGSLGNIDEQEGHPGKGSPGATTKPEHNPERPQDEKPEKPKD